MIPLFRIIAGFTTTQPFRLTTSPSRPKIVLFNSFLSFNFLSPISYSITQVTNAFNNRSLGTYNRRSYITNIKPNIENSVNLMSAISAAQKSAQEFRSLNSDPSTSIPLDDNHFTILHRAMEASKTSNAPLSVKRSIFAYLGDSLYHNQHYEQFVKHVEKGMELAWSPDSDKVNIPENYAETLYMLGRHPEAYDWINKEYKRFMVTASTMIGNFESLNPEEGQKMALDGARLCFRLGVGSPSPNDSIRHYRDSLTWLERFHKLESPLDDSLKEELHEVSFAVNVNLSTTLMRYDLGKSPETTRLAALHMKRAVDLRFDRWSAHKTNEEFQNEFFESAHAYCDLLDEMDDSKAADVYWIELTQTVQERFGMNMTSNRPRSKPTAKPSSFPGESLEESASRISEEGRQLMKYNQYSKALPFFEEATKLCRKIGSKEKLLESLEELATCYQCLSSVMPQSQQTDQSVQHHTRQTQTQEAPIQISDNPFSKELITITKESLNVAQQIHGRIHPEIVRLLNNLVILHHENRNTHEVANHYLQSALTICNELKLSENEDPYATTKTLVMMVGLAELEKDLKTGKLNLPPKPSKKSIAAVLDQSAPSIKSDDLNHHHSSLQSTNKITNRKGTL